MNISPKQFEEYPPKFTRPDLMETKERGGHFYETEVKWINPREFHRKAISDIEDLGFKIIREQDEKLKVEQEEIGSSTGFIESRIRGVKKCDGKGITEYFPYRNIGIGIIIFGIFLSLISIYEIIMLLLGILMLAVGVLTFFYKTNGEFKVRLDQAIRVLSVGEATERTIKRKGADVTDLFAQLTVSFSGESIIYCIPYDIKKEPLKREIEKKVSNAFWHMPFEDSNLVSLLQDDTLREFYLENKKLKGAFDLLKEKISQYGVDIEHTTPEKD